MAGAAVGARSGLAPSVGACSGRESGEARVGGGGKPCPVAEKRSMPLLPVPLIPAAKRKNFQFFDWSGGSAEAKVANCCRTSLVDPLMICHRICHMSCHLICSR